MDPVMPGTVGFNQLPPMGLGFEEIGEAETGGSGLAQCGFPGNPGRAGPSCLDKEAHDIGLKRPEPECELVDPNFRKNRVVGHFPQDFLFLSMVQIEFSLEPDLFLVAYEKLVGIDQDMIVRGAYALESRGRNMKAFDDG